MTASTLTDVLPYLLGAVVFLFVLKHLIPGKAASNEYPRQYPRAYGSGRKFIWFGKNEGRRSRSRKEEAAVDRDNPNRQIRHILNADFVRQPFMNREEYAVYMATRDALRSVSNRYHVFPQAPMGELFKSRCQVAFKAINTKRLDVVIVDAWGRAAAAVEYHGGGHFQGNAIQRDRIKKCALERAGIPLIELYEGFERGDLEQQLRAALKAGAAPAAE
ncbi:DUF2726 domain-containing protein [Algihabitans sp.]|uniref:DUF2726 domain-containing protein n=1 Tax=Algihabitans sp. TaxID=2821514 RepID=UPI003BAA7C00